MSKKNIFKKLNKNLLKTKTSKYLVLGSLTFFFVKGLIWLGIFLYASFNLINLT